MRGLVFFCDLGTFGIGLHAIPDPAAALGSVNVVNLDADGGGVDGAGFAGVFAFDLMQFGRRARTEEAEGIEVAFEVSPLAEGVEDALAVGVFGVVGGRFDNGCPRAAVDASAFRSGHISAVLE